MKPQDIFFIVIIVALLFRNRPKWLIFAGEFCLIVSIPLFYFQIFFTAQRLTYYAAAFFLIAIIYNLLKNYKKGEK